MVYIKRWLEYYDELFPIEENQVEFFQKLSKNFPNPAKFLSVECGSACLSRELANYNIDVTVTDTYPEFISSLTGKLKNTDNKIHAFNLNPMDIIRYMGKGFFNIIYSGDYRLIFLKEKTAVLKLMIDAKMMLSDGGYLVLDLINFSKYDFSSPRIDLATQKSENAQLYSYILKDSTTMKYTLNQQVITKEGKNIDEVKNEEITPISMETFKSFANQVNFSSIEFYSDYYGTPLKPNSEKIICVIRK